MTSRIANLNFESNMMILSQIGKKLKKVQPMKRLKV